MLDMLSGETRVFVLIGHPIAQVKAPGPVTKGFVARGLNAALIPIHVLPENVGAFIDALGPVCNVDGIIATIPHKFAAQRHCKTLSDRARLLTSANVIRRGPGRAWHGDMLDGLGFVRAMVEAGCEPAGKPALLIGAGGAGSAIGLQLLDSGVTELAVHDMDSGRRDALIARLSGAHPGRVRIGSTDPSGFGIVANATPMGMREGDPLPVEADRLTADMFVGDVITAPEVSPLLEIARGLGCKTQTGVGMFLAQRELIIDFLVGKPD
ncbi:shikimate dehydrogenase family protein [Bosea sp. (in: a-proteobacteria)]|jgi:shikimate dehydrogenase|uniref:shikimate dehydrogenase family protein n=1 Tax=Bosea sp. (in: a-proteobacteria) TaxID=1871050 RepID=UPI003F70EE46